MADEPSSTTTATVPMDTADPPTSSTEIATDEETNKSALQDNIERKGKNAYYFAHAHKSTGPQWDGKPQPKLLSKQESQHLTTKPAFDYSKSNISKYAFLDETKCVKLYIDMEGVGDKCTDEDIVLEYTSTSMNLVVNNYKEKEPPCLCFGKLTASIDSATCKRKKDKLIVTLTKTKEGEWHTINDKGTPDHEIV